MSDNKSPKNIEPAAGSAFSPGLSTVLPHAEIQDEQLIAVDRKAKRFDHLSPLGEGSAGQVELVRDNDIGRFVAIKRLKHTDNPQHVLRFAREARCLGQLEHPGIVPVHDVGRGEDGTYFLVMKHLEGESLEELINKLRAGDAKSHDEFPMPARVRICESILRVMEYAHERGIVHRDIKPGNIMVGKHGEVAIVDWGLAKRLEEGASAEDVIPPADSFGPAEDMFATQTDTLLGTPLYMSPEQAAGDTDAVGPASDAYSLAVVFYELLSLEHYLPKEGDLSSVVKGVLKHEAKLAYWVTSKHQDRVPIELAYWLQKAMSKERSGRFSSVKEMRSELQRATCGRFAVVCPTTLSRRAFGYGMDTANRRPIAMLAFIASVVFLASYGAWRMLLDVSG